MKNQKEKTDTDKKKNVRKKPDKKWDTLKDSESLQEKAPPLKHKKK